MVNIKFINEYDGQTYKFERGTYIKDFYCHKQQKSFDIHC